MGFCFLVIVIIGVISVSVGIAVSEPIRDAVLPTPHHTLVTGSTQDVKDALPTGYPEGTLYPIPPQSPQI
jgi:hypothetical protein